jgi:hypothetical protein
LNLAGNLSRYNSRGTNCSLVLSDELSVFFCYK